MKNIFVSDFTLKNFAAEGTTLLFREKAAIAAAVLRFGANRIELAPVKSFKEDSIIYKTISSADGVEFCLPAGFSEDEIETAFACIKDSPCPCLQIAVPVSTVGMEYGYHLKGDKMLKKISSLITFARSKCRRVEFVALDATRADLDFLISAVRIAEQAGAGVITISDDAGISLPEDFASLIATVRKETSAELYVLPSDSISMATACALAAVNAGADGVKTAVSGKNVLTVSSFARATEAVGTAIGISTTIKYSEIYSKTQELLKGISSTEEKKETGEKDFVFLNTDSDLAEVKKAACLLGYDLSDSDSGKVYDSLLRVCEKKTSVGAKELEAIIASSAMQAPSTYHLVSYLTSSSNIANAMTHICLKRDDEVLDGVAIGDGAIDSAFKAIAQIMGFDYELDNFEIQAVTEGKEALGEALVRLRSGGKLYSGNGISTDIVGASIRAYIGAVNKIVYEED